MSVLLPGGLHLVGGQDADIITLLQILRHHHCWPGGSAGQNNVRQQQLEYFCLKWHEQIYFSQNERSVASTLLWRLWKNDQEETEDEGQHQITSSKYRGVTNIQWARKEVNTWAMRRDEQLSSQRADLSGSEIWSTLKSSTHQRNTCFYLLHSQRAAEQNHENSPDS